MSGIPSAMRSDSSPSPSSGRPFAPIGSGFRDLPEQHLTADRAIQELDRIRQVNFEAGRQTITAVIRRNGLQQQILAVLGVDTRARTDPSSTADRGHPTPPNDNM